MNNIYVLNKNYSKIGTLSNQGANPQAPYYEDLFVQELETGADTYQFSTMSTPYTQDILEIGNHIMFTYKNRNELFTITSLEYSHNEGYKTIGVYAEGIGFDLLEIYMKRPENEKESSSGGSSSGSGGSSSGGGRDEDNDGDDNTDDEYADVDDVYVDENGIIIYDKYGQDDYADPDNVSVDENGVIIYRRNKHNRKKDSLEFQNISYSRFLSILLKNTGWSYVCQPGLESIKHDITVRYDTNIFALLQDSMQSYRGVELEFVHELVGGRVQKVIKAYKDGGRGSFVGKRFEYGKNVRGITKTQEVANSEDDTILYIDNVGINVQYDVDFALKSAEVPEIEIGDTHYVIDNDFCPPMQIKARIGKIEISFSDPTRNKIYLANNKRISGSAIEDEFGADDVADMLDDYEYGDNGAAYDHYHDRLICDNEKTYVSEDGKTQGTTRWKTSVELSDDKLLPAEADSYYLGDEYTPWRDIFTKYVTCNDRVITPSIRAYDYDVNFDRVDMQNVEEVTNKQELLDFIVNNINIYEYSAIEIDNIANAPENHPYQIYYGILAEDFVNHGDKCTVTDPVARRIMRGLVMTDTDNDGSLESEDGHNRHTYNIPALLTALIGAFQYYVSGGTPNNPGGGTGGSTGYFDDLYINYELIVGDTNNSNFTHLTDVSVSAQFAYIYDRLETDTIYVNRIRFADGSALTTANGSGGSSAGNIFEEKTDDKGEIYYHTDKDLVCEDLTCDNLNVVNITFPDGSKLTSSNNGGSGGSPSCDCGLPADYFYMVRQVSSPLIYTVGTDHNMEFNGGVVRIDGYLEVYDDDSSLSGTSVPGRIDCKELNGEKVHGQTVSYYNIKPLSDETIKENIRYLDNSSMPMTYGNDIDSGIVVYKENLGTRNYNDEDLLEKADLYDFIVNQINICEYNFIDDDTKKIGFIADEYEGTKIGDRLINKEEFTKVNHNGEIIERNELLTYDMSNLLFATIGALQEEVRIKDEQIASLEARLAAIEAILDINNDN